MNNILKKETKLSASILAYIFLAFGLMFFIPGYPILCGVFFITLGLFQSFQYAREANDILFSALLPIAKKDVVKGRFQFVILIELAGFVIMTVCTLIRMTVLSNAFPYRQNALMNANPYALAVALVIFSLFNLIFVAGYFKTAYKFAKSFVTYIVVAFLVLGAAEASHHVPGFSALNAFGFDYIGLQLITLVCGIIIYILVTLASLKLSIKRFEKIDL